MQLELLTKEHEVFLSEVVGISPEDFKAMSFEEMDALADDKLIDLECDGAADDAPDESKINTKYAAEIIDIIYGPYNPEEINSDIDDDTAKQAEAIAA